MFNPRRGGTASFPLHTSKHRKANRSAVPTKLAFAMKQRIAKGAGMAVVQGNMPFFFAESPGMQIFAESLFCARQQISVAKDYEISDSLSVAKTVTTAVADLACLARKQFREEGLAEVLEMGGGVSTDGLKHRATSRHFYDVNVYYFVIVKAGPMQLCSLQLKARTLLLEEHFGASGAVNIISKLNVGMSRDYGISFQDLSRN